MKPIFITSILIFVCFSAQSQTLKNKQKMTNAEITQAINKAVQKGDVETASSLVKENYIQHTPVVPDGKIGLATLVTKIKRGDIPAPKINNVRTLTDGEYVILHHDIQWPNRKSMFEIFRIENGLAAEHWSGIQDHPDKTVSGQSMLDGATEIMNREHTEKNKEFVKSFVETVFIKGQFDKISDFCNPEMIQHNPFIDHTISGLITGVEELQKQGITIQIKKIWKVFGEGNFVLVCSEGIVSGKPTAFFDLFRVENNKIAEHWDVLQEVPEKSAHDNGFFEASLYKRLGGFDGIAAFVDIAFPKVAAHPELNKYFVGHSTDTQMRQRQLLIDKLCNDTQGAAVYIGRPLTTAHEGLNITAKEWDIFMSVLLPVMDERNITGDDKTDFIELWQGYRSETVEAELNKSEQK